MHRRRGSQDMLIALDLEKSGAVPRGLRETRLEAKRKKFVKRLKIVEAFIESGAVRNG